MILTPVFPEIIPPTPIKYILELNKEEAEDLQLICRFYLEPQTRATGLGHYSSNLAVKLKKGLPENKSSVITNF